MGIEHITDADYWAVPETKTSHALIESLGPLLKCGSSTLLPNCTHPGCVCPSVSTGKQQPVRHAKA